MSTTELGATTAESGIDATVGKRVHTLMWEQRVKNKDIASLLDLDPTAVGKKLRAEQKFSIEQLSVVARHLKTTIAYLVGESSVPHPTPPIVGGGNSLVMSERGPYRARTDDIHGGMRELGNVIPLPIAS